MNHGIFTNNIHIFFEYFIDNPQKWAELIDKTILHKDQGYGVIRGFTKDNEIIIDFISGTLLFPLQYFGRTNDFIHLELPYDLDIKYFLKSKGFYLLLHQIETNQNPNNFSRTGLEIQQKITKGYYDFNEKEKKWLKKYSMFDILAIFYSDLFIEHSKIEDLINACIYWYKGFKFKEILREIDEERLNLSTKHQQLLLTLRGHALRELYYLNAAEETAIQAFRDDPCCYYSYNLLGSIAFQSSGIEKGIQFFSLAQNLGANKKWQKEFAKKMLKIVHPDKKREVLRFCENRETTEIKPKQNHYMFCFNELNIQTENPVSYQKEEKPEKAKINFSSNEYKENEVKNDKYFYDPNSYDEITYNSFQDDSYNYDDEINHINYYEEEFIFDKSMDTQESLDENEDYWY